MKVKTVVGHIYISCYRPIVPPGAPPPLSKIYPKFEDTTDNEVTIETMVGLSGSKSSSMLPKLSNIWFDLQISCVNSCD